jgi:hypothetical protein
VSAHLFLLLSLLLLMTNCGGGDKHLPSSYPPEYNDFPITPKPYSWSIQYILGRSELATMPEQMFLLQDWTYVGRDGVVATKTLRSTCRGMCDQEVSTFTLKEGDGSGASPPS